MQVGDGVVPMSKDCTQDLQPIWDPGQRSVCLQLDSPADSSWQKNAHCQYHYQCAWTSWQKWCANQCLDKSSVCVEKLLEYL